MMRELHDSLAGGRSLEICFITDEKPLSRKSAMVGMETSESFPTLLKDSILLSGVPSGVIHVYLFPGKTIGRVPTPTQLFKIQKIHFHFILTIYYTK